MMKVSEIYEGEIYEWMDKQIEACKAQNIPLIKEKPFFVCNASARFYDSEEGKYIHVYGIHHLYKMLRELGQPVEVFVKDRSDEFETHYFMYKGYKFFGLIHKGGED